MATNYAVNYDDKRFQQVEKEQSAAIKETKSTYDSMINNSNKYYQQQIDASKDWANKQSELQQAQTDFAIEKVEQAKEQAKKDYTKEQKGAYTDYQKATNQYGVNAEQLASQGLNQTGYSESTRTNIFNTYQNRYMAARESYNQAILNYDNSIKEAQLANNSALAKIAYEALQQQLELSLQGFQYKNTLLLQKLDAVNTTKDRYYNRYQDVLGQINTENALAEEVRQYNATLAEQKRQHNETLAEDIRQYNSTLAFQKAQEAENIRQYNKTLDLQKSQLAEEIRQYNETIALQKSQAAQEQSNWEKEYELSKKKINSSSSTSGNSGKSSSSSSTTLSDTSSKSSKGTSNATLKQNIEVSSVSNTKLSSAGEKLYQSLSAMSNKSSIGGNAYAIANSKKLNISNINSSYKSGKITASDVKIILNRLGYE